MPATSDLFPDAKVGDAIAQSRYPYPPHKRTIAKVTATRITDDADNVWRRSDGKKVGDTSAYGVRNDVQPSALPASSVATAPLVRSPPSSRAPSTSPATRG